MSAAIERSSQLPVPANDVVDHRSRNNRLTHAHFVSMVIKLDVMTYPLSPESYAWRSIGIAPTRAAQESVIDTQRCGLRLKAGRCALFGPIAHALAAMFSSLFIRSGVEKLMCAKSSAHGGGPNEHP